MQNDRSRIDWRHEIVDQLSWHWEHAARPRLTGLTDDEYLWEPVADCWSVRPRSQATSSMATGAADVVLDYAWPEPAPAPVTTIAWRMAHLIVGVFGARVGHHFGGPVADYQSWDYAPTAAKALDQLDEAYSAWLTGVRGLQADELAHPVGDAEGPWAAKPMATLILHINREAIHHMAEIALLRDLYLRQGR